MSSVLIGIIGVIFFIGLALAGASYFGTSLVSTRIDAQATDYLNQSSQIARAIQQYASDNGTLPISGQSNPIDILIAGKYMTVAPPGGSSTWTYVSSAQAMLATVSGSSDTALKICIAARTRAKVSNPSTVLQCDGSGGALSKTDPCCLR